MTTYENAAESAQAPASRRTYRWLALGAVGGPVLFTVAWLALGFVSPGYTAWGVHIAPYSPISQSISGLGLGPTGPYMNAVFVLSGVLMMVGAAGICLSIRDLSAVARWTCLALLALPGLGSVLDGLFTIESFFGHSVVGFGLILTSVLGLPAVGWLLRSVPGWHRIGTWLLLSGPLTLALAVLYFASFTPTATGAETGIAGLTERMLVLEIQAWYVGLGWLAFGRPAGT